MVTLYVARAPGSPSDANKNNMKPMIAAACVALFVVDLAVAVPLNDGDENFAGSIKKAVIHTGSRGGGLVASTNAVAVLPHTIPYIVT